MQSLLSRAAQAQSSCRCRICHHSRNTIARQSTNPNAAPRRKVNAADLFTACYTTILGTAAVIDARRKDDRRKELDGKLEKARTALSTLAGQQAGGNDKTDTTATNVPRNRVFLPKRRERDNTKALLQELASLCEVTRRPLTSSSWIQDQVDWVRIEAAIAIEEQDPNYALREPKSDHQLELTTTTVLELVNELLWRSQTHKSLRSQDNADTNGASGEGEAVILREIQEIRQGSHYPSYEHPIADTDNAARVRCVLGESVRRIFNQAAGSGEVVGKICYNLLTSSIPPSIHTYNALIAGFNRIQRPDLSQAVVDSYIHKTAWPATQQTMVCLLNHYRGTNEIQGLRDTIKRMRGVRDTGLNFRILPKQATYSQEWLAWATKNCASRKHAFVERANRGTEVFDSIIKGWLHHGQVGNASMVFVACLRSGGSIPVQTLNHLLTACLATVDHAAARRLIKGIAKHFRRFAVMLESIVRGRSATTSRKVVLSLSHLADMCWLPYKDIFGPVGKSYEQVTDELKSLLSNLKLHIEMQETTELCMAALKKLSSGASLMKRLDGAIAGFEDAQHSRRRTTEAMIGFTRLSSVLSIENRYHDLEGRIKDITAPAKAIILRIKTGYEIDPSSLLASQQQKHSKMQRSRRLEICNALQALQLHSGRMTERDIRSQLIKRLPNPVLVRRLESSGNCDNLTIRALTTFYTPGATTFRKPENRGYSRSIRQIEQKLIDTEDFIRAILFTHLSGDTQRKLRFWYQNWYEMPLDILVKYHLRKCAPPVPSAQKAHPAVLGELVDHRDHINGVDVAVSNPSSPNEPHQKTEAMPTSTTSSEQFERQIHATKPVSLSYSSRRPSLLSDDGLSLHFATMG